MSSGLKVGVKYCGHCNPRLNGPEVIKAVQAMSDEIEFIHWDDPQVAMLLIVGACPSACASQPPFEGPIITLSDISLLEDNEANNIRAEKQILIDLQVVLAELNKHLKVLDK